MVANCCVQCGVPIEKNDGCFMMTCQKWYELFSPSFRPISLPTPSLFSHLPFLLIFSSSFTVGINSAGCVANHGRVTTTISSATNTATVNLMYLPPFSSLLSLSPLLSPLSSLPCPSKNKKLTKNNRTNQRGWMGGRTPMLGRHWIDTCFTTIGIQRGRGRDERGGDEKREEGTKREGRNGSKQRREENVI